MNFPERLISLRQDKGLTQNDLANLVQISRSALSLYELGKREPDFSILSKLAQFFGVTTDYLLGRPSDTPALNSIPRNSHNPDLRAIARASEKLTSEEAATYRKIGESLFPEKFKK